MLECCTQHISRVLESPQVASAPFCGHHERSRRRAGGHGIATQIFALAPNAALEQSVHVSSQQAKRTTVLPSSLTSRHRAGCTATSSASCTDQCACDLAATRVRRDFRLHGDHDGACSGWIGAHRCIVTSIRNHHISIKTTAGGAHCQSSQACMTTTRGYPDLIAALLTSSSASASILRQQGLMLHIKSKSMASARRQVAS